MIGMNKLPTWGTVVLEEITTTRRVYLFRRYCKYQIKYLTSTKSSLRPLRATAMCIYEEITNRCGYPSLSVRWVERGWAIYQKERQQKMQRSVRIQKTTKRVTEGQTTQEWEWATFELGTIWETHVWARVDNVKPPNENQPWRPSSCNNGTTGIIICLFWVELATKDRCFTSFSPDLKISFDFGVDFWSSCETQLKSIGATNPPIKIRSWQNKWKVRDTLWEGGLKVLKILEQTRTAIRRDLTGYFKWEWISR